MFICSFFIVIFAQFLFTITKFVQMRFLRFLAIRLSIVLVLSVPVSVLAGSYAGMSDGLEVEADNHVLSESDTVADGMTRRDLRLVGRMNSPASQKFDKITSSRTFGILAPALPAIVLGTSLKFEDNDYSGYANSYKSVFRNKFDDYLQYAPAAVLLGMKIGGVKGRSTWGCMLTADAFSVALMTGAVNLLKHTMDTRRPDGSAYNSFPSGHTATAFMTATMLNKEFGNLSPWVTMGSYTMAVATGIGRQLNMRHWGSDIIVGAGIGILATELGYLFADLIFKDKGLKNVPESLPEWGWDRKPSFFRLVAGAELVLGGYYLPDGTYINVKAGNGAGYEGAWFPHRNVGIGASFRVGNNVVALNDEILEGWLGYMAPYAGVFYSVPLSKRWSWDAKTLAGYNFFWHKDSWDEYGMPRSYGSFGMMLGTSLSFLATDDLRVSLLADYNLITRSPLEPSRCQHNLLVGGAASVMF